MNKKYLGVILVAISLISLGSCKPKQSSYKSVYEAAIEKEMGENNTSSATIPVTKAETPIQNNLPETVHKEKLTPATDADARKLKTYSVVVAAMAMKPSAESLRERLGKAGYNVILAKNNQDMYRVIIASCETKEEAIKKRNEILANFASSDDFATLKSKYGIPFNDWWILQRDF